MGGALGSFTTLHRAAVGDARGSTRTLNRELIYDDQYAAGARDYGAAVWMDARDAACGAQELQPCCPSASGYAAWRYSLIRPPRTGVRRTVPVEQGR